MPNVGVAEGHVVLDMPTIDDKQISQSLIYGKMYCEYYRQCCTVSSREMSGLLQIGWIVIRDAPIRYWPIIAPNNQPIIS